MFPFSFLIYIVLLIYTSLQIKFYSLTLFSIVLLYCILCVWSNPKVYSYPKPLSGMNGEPHFALGIYKLP